MKENSQEKQEPIDSQKAHKSIGARIGSVYKRAKAYLEGKKGSVLSSIEKNYQKLSHTETAPPKALKISKEQAKKYLQTQNIEEEFIKNLEKIGKSPKAGWKKLTGKQKFSLINNKLYFLGHGAAVTDQSVQKMNALIHPLIAQSALELQASMQTREAFIAKIKELLSTPEFRERIKEQTKQEMKLYDSAYDTVINCMALAGIKVDEKLDRKIRVELLGGLSFVAHQNNMDAAIDELAKQQSVNVQFDELIRKKARELEQAKSVEPKKLEAVSETQEATLYSASEIEESEKQEEQEEKEEQVELEQVTYDPEAEPEALATELESEQQEQKEVLAQSDEQKSPREESPKIAQKDDLNTQSMPVMHADSLLSKLQSALEDSTGTLSVRARIAQLEGHTTEKKVESKKSQDSETIPQRTQVKSMINMFNSYQKSQHTERAVDPETPEKSRSVKLR
ncbi:hypothetical protein CC99x_010920 [Candidatus Berkiella cookevillensis]|uniref:Uncharacterized protein n=1 Tax=Candidatus Berkiella cookevillensis TaxID=437022 RepID=A0A0Q9YEY4_9GAMM|nr:hypothetical protein [Candidatus Berkiella cookevillensis]MCS5709412.1 hypothetical protein [Candidatus Berkiella cookevillensis]